MANPPIPSLKNFKYENQTVNQLKGWMGKALESEKDKAKAGIKVCEGLIQAIKWDKTMNYGPRALEPLRKLQASLKKGVDSLISNKILENGKNLVNDIVNLIDNAENETLKRLAKNRATQDSRDLVKKSAEISKTKAPMFTMEGGDDIHKQTGNIVFTKESNPVKIHKALEGLFKNPDTTYTIDYSGCKNQNIKSWMHSVLGCYTCLLTYDSKQKTYVLRDTEGKPVQVRARIREGVKLIPAGIRKWNAYVEEKTEKEKAGKIDYSKIDKQTAAMIKAIPDAKDELSPNEQKQLCIKTEERVLELLKNAKKLGYEIDPESVTKIFRGSGHMELHLNTGDSEVSWTVRKDEKIIGKKLYDFIDGNEGDYKDYLIARVKEKLKELDPLTKTEKVKVGAGSKEIIIGGEAKQQILYGMGLLETMIENYRESEGDSWLDNDDKNLVEIKKLLRNGKASIEDTDNIGKSGIIKNIIEPIRTKRKSIKRISAKGDQYTQLNNIFFGNKDQQIAAIRSLGGFGRLFDKTETSFLAEEIEGNEDIGVKNPEIQKCIDKIKNRTSMSIYNQDGSINQKVKGRYDNTYASAQKGTDSLITLFVGRGWLPSNRKEEDDEVRKCMDGLREQLVSIDTQVNNLSLSVEGEMAKGHKERLRLEQKDNKTEAEMQVLQALVYLDENPEKAREHYKKTIEITNIQLKYGDLGQIVKGGLMSALGELGGGITGKNADIYNDIKGYGFWNLSDESAKKMGDIVGEIVITAAVTMLTMGVGSLAVAGVLRCASLVAKGAKWVKLADKIGKTATRFAKFAKVLREEGKMFKALNTATKGLSTTGKVAFGTTLSTSYLVEGTAFNAVSNIIHSAMNGTSLDSLNLNPIAKENVQTAAFLGALSIAGSFTNGLMRAGGRTKLSVNFMKGLEKAHLQAPAKFTTGLVAEMGSMLAAEQVINLTFGHDVIDPETGEVHTEHSLVAPTQQELCQIIGMIIAFRAVKPGIWQKYEQKLNNGTIEICRTENRKNPVVRNTKTGMVVPLKDLPNNTSILDSRGKTGAETGAETGGQRTVQDIFNDLANGKINYKAAKREIALSTRPDRTGGSDGSDRIFQDAMEDLGRVNEGKSPKYDWSKVASKGRRTGSKAETGEGRAETGERRAETGERRAETGERRAETGERRDEGNDRADKPEDVERNLEKAFSNARTENYNNVKLDWVTQKMFETGVFIRGVHRRFKNLSLRPNMKLPKEFLKKLKIKLVEMKNKWGKRLNEYYRKLIDKYNNYIERKLAEKGEEVEIKNEEINSMEKKEIKYTKDVNGNILSENYERMSAEELIQEYQHLRDYEASGKRYRWMKKTPSGKEIYKNSHDSSAKKAEIRKILEEKYQLDKNGNPIRIDEGMGRTEFTEKASSKEGVKLGDNVYKIEKEGENFVLKKNGKEVARGKGREDMRAEYDRVLNEYKGAVKLREVIEQSKVEDEFLDGIISTEGIKIGKDIYKIEKEGENFVLKKNGKEVVRGKGREDISAEYDRVLNEYKNERLADKEGDASYFNGKKSRFNISERMARENSKIMDKIMNSQTSSNLKFLRETISLQYKAATGKECPNLTDQQLRTIIKAHKQLGELGNLTQGELLKKVRILSETITDVNIRRFLLESGFCGRGGRNGIDASLKKSLVDRDQLADTISKNRFIQGGYPKGIVEIRRGEPLSIDKFFRNHLDMKAKYEEALKIQDERVRSEELSKIDVEVAEQFILEKGRAIEFGVGKAEKAEASYQALNEVYNGKVEKIVREDGSIVLRLKQEITQAPRKKRETAKKRKEGSKNLETQFNKSLVDRDQFADTISKNRFIQGGYPKGNVEIRKGRLLSIDKFFRNHLDMKAKYEEALKIQDERVRSEELSKIDVEVAEQFILESGRAIEFGVGKAEKAEASYQALNKVYNGKVEKIVREDGSVVLRLKQEAVSSGGEVVPVQKGEVVPVQKGEVVPVQKGEVVPVQKGEVVPIDKMMTPAVKEKLNTALAIIEKKGGLPAIIEKNTEIIDILPSRKMVSPYWLIPLLLLPRLLDDEEDKKSKIIKVPDDFSRTFEKIQKNPKITGVELSTDITGPFDSRGNSNAIKAEIDAKFADLIKENNIKTPLRNNALILLRGVSSRTYKGKGNGEQYNKDLSLTRAEEFKKYLMQKFPELTEDNFVLDSHYQPDNIDAAQRFQGVSMGVVDMEKYGGITSMKQLIPSGQDGRVL